MKTTIVLLTLLLVACGQSPVSPTPPSVSTQTEAAATADANIVSVGALYTYQTYRNAPNIPAHLIDGVGHNLGAGCATQVTGTLMVEGARATVSWALPPAQVVTAGSQFWYSAKIESDAFALPRNVTNYTTTFKWTNVACPDE